MKTTETKLVTPVLAEELLQSSRGNRKIKASHLKNMVKVMLAGEWPENIQSNTISFDSRGRLADGHHRLNAIIKSGVTLLLNLEYGLSDHDIKFLDCGKSRSYADYLTLKGRQQTRSMAAVIKMVHDLAYGYEEKLTMDEMDYVDRRIGNIIHESLKYGNNSVIQTTVMLAREVFSLESSVITQIVTGYNVEKFSIADIVRGKIHIDGGAIWAITKRYLICLDALDRIHRYKNNEPFVKPRKEDNTEKISTMIKTWLENELPF